MEEVTVEFTKADAHEQYRLRKGLGLVALKNRSKLIEYDCLKADCGICIVRIVSGMENLNEKTSAEADFLRAMRADPEERLACQCRAFGNLSIEIDPDLIPN